MILAHAGYGMSASSDKACAVPVGPRSRHAFDRDVCRLHTGAPWPRWAFGMALNRWSWGARASSIVSQYQAEYPAIWDIATNLSLNKLLGRHKR